MAVREKQEDVIADIMVGGTPPKTYSFFPGIRLSSKIYVDNLKFIYYKREYLVNIILLAKKLKASMCLGTASVSWDVMDNRLSLLNPHKYNS